MKGRNFLTRLGLSLAATVLVCSFGAGSAIARPVTTPGSVPDYWETPNWAFSPALHKFVDTLPQLCTTSSLTDPGKNNLGQCIPVAEADTTTYPGSDYYEIEVVQYRSQMNSDLPPVTGSDNMYPNASGGTVLRGYRQINTTNPNLLTPHFLGPLIISQKDRPVRVKLINKLPIGADGNLFLPVDGTIMGSGEFDIDYDPATKEPTALNSGTFTQNRALLHLHGGRNPWISDGTPHQWITPAGESTTYPKGVSVSYVPDMWFDASGNTVTACAGQTTCATAGASNNPGSGAQTYFWTNEQSARLMFYHDHAWGITRLNVYAGMAAGYLIRDTVEQNLITAGTIPGAIAGREIPLVIEDKTFVDASTIVNTDPTWAWGSQPWNGTQGAAMTPQTGDLWWPHVYMPAENPYDTTGAGPLGRWVYGPWFFPPTPVCGSTPDAVQPFCVDQGAVPNPYYGAANPNQPPEIPGTPNVSWGAEAFLDTMTVNGTAYPSLSVSAQSYRFRILNAAHDRSLNLQMYVADPSYTAFDPATGLPNPGFQKEVKMVPAAFNAAYPTGWPQDGREGGVPDPSLRGPAFIQIGTDSGFLPNPVVLPNRPIKWNTDVTLFNAGNVLQQNEGGGTLFLGPAERADVIVDFSQFAGKTLILYNDAPAPWPALDPHYDFYTNDPDRQDIGGAPSTPPGFGPNVRTIMQIKVSGSGGIATPDYYNPTTLANLQTAFASTATTPGAFATGQDPIIVGQAAYNGTYPNTTFPSTYPNWGISRITDDAISFKTVDGTTVSNYPMKRKAIHDEMGGTFDVYGRLAAKLGLEIPFANAALQTFVLQNFVDPPTETVHNNEIQLWRITHNGVDTHPVHFHLFDVQVINRVGWDGFIRLPDPNELGWKDTVRVSPLEDTIVALKPKNIIVPFALPNSIRPLNPSQPIGSQVGFSQIDTATGGPLATPQTNELHNFGHEYVWHCHILSHEENDMMRTMVLNTNAQTEILWRNPTTGENWAWNMDGTTLASSVQLQTFAGPNWNIVGTGDFNGDGNRDIVWRDSTSGDNWIWLMNGTTRTSSVQLQTVPGTDWYIGGTGDFNGDGKPDIIWRNSSNGDNWIWLMNGTTRTSSVQLQTFPGANWKIVGGGDFNDDGKPDIYWRDSTSGDNWVWLMNGTTRTSSVQLPSLASPWEIVGIGDFNDDVYRDILWRNPSTGENMVWFMKHTTQLGSSPVLTIPAPWNIVGH
ncbi:MAG: FG-GAP-like repeat-containing protein [Geobacteraceae bacterium]